MIHIQIATPKRHRIIVQFADIEQHSSDTKVNGVTDKESEGNTTLGKSEAFSGGKVKDVLYGVKMKQLTGRGYLCIV